jgi:signal transduction histidine kinase
MDNTAILIVDDDKCICKSLQEMLSGEGYKTAYALEAGSALELMEGSGAQLILCDHFMPGMSGVEMLERIKEIHPEVVRILMTGFASTEICTEAVNRGGVYKIVTKPFGDFEDLKSVIRTGVGYHEVLMENKRLLESLERSAEQRTGKLEKALKELKQAQSHLVQSEKMASIGRLVAGIAHEINNPLAFIQSNRGSLRKYLDRLTEFFARYEDAEKVACQREISSSEGGETAALPGKFAELKRALKVDFILEDVPKLIEESGEGVRRVKQIVSDLKSFSHPGGDGLKLANINDGLESTLNIVWNELKYKARVARDFGELPHVACYPERLNQVFMNILVNAAQAIQDKGEIRITTRLVEQSDCTGGGKSPLSASSQCIFIEISDTGCGISREHMSKVFDPFFTTKEVGKGTGLGLNMAYNIIQQHGGRIDVDSTVGEGTTFTVRLPVLTDVSSTPEDCS